MDTQNDHSLVFEKNKSLGELSTLGVGGIARYFVEVKTISEMSTVLSLCHEHAFPYLLVGKGSNSLFSDEGFDGVVIANRISYLNIDKCTVDVGAGYSFSLLGVKTARKNLAGLEFASGIPGSVGGAVYMNAGANGQETCETLEEVLYLDEEGALSILSKEELSFSYRYSCFHEMKGAIVGARFVLKPCDKARERQLAIVDYRMKTQPYQDKSAGCFFRNPEGHSAGALIEKCQLKGMRVGGAEVSPMHANFIVNREGAKAEDILALAKMVREKVKEQTGISLEFEVRGVDDVSC